MLIDRNYEAYSNIKQYVQIQHLIKKRTLLALMNSKNTFIEQINDDVNKNRSQTFLKISAKPAESLNFSPNQRIQHEED